MTGLTNYQLEKLGKKILGPIFLGVYPSDATPKLKNTKNQSVIFNLSKHNTKGSHYVAIHFNNDTIFYFDSYGKKLSNKYILKFLKAYKLPIFFHNKKIQTNESIFCSLYTLGYLKAVQKLKLTPKSFYDMFPDRPKKYNDTIVTNFLMKKYKQM